MIVLVSECKNVSYYTQNSMEKSRNVYILRALVFVFMALIHKFRMTNNEFDTDIRAAYVQISDSNLKFNY